MLGLAVATFVRQQAEKTIDQRPVADLDLKQIPDAGWELRNRHLESLYRLRRLSLKVIPGATVFIPARNEERNIGPALDGLLAAYLEDQVHSERTGAKPTISEGVVVLNGCSDRTEEKFDEWVKANRGRVWVGRDATKDVPPNDHRLRLWLLHSPPGKDQAQLRFGRFCRERKALSEHLFTVDADIRIRAGDAMKLRDFLEEGGLPATAGMPVYISEPGAPRQLMYDLFQRRRAIARIGTPFLPGGYLFRRTIDALAAWEAMDSVKKNPGAEDPIECCAYLLSGKKAKLNFKVPFDVEIPNEWGEQLLQRLRWEEGGKDIFALLGQRPNKFNGTQAAFLLWTWIHHPLKFPKQLPFLLRLKAEEQERVQPELAELKRSPEAWRRGAEMGWNTYRGPTDPDSR